MMVMMMMVMMVSPVKAVLMSQCLHSSVTLSRFLYSCVYKLNHCGIRTRNQADCHHEIFLILLLKIEGSSLPPPVLTVFPPSRAELQSNKATLVCLSRLSAPFAEVSWLLGDTSVSSGISTSTPVQQADQTFQISSHLSILTSDWDAQKVYTCKVSVGSQTAEKSLKKSECEE
ncbi:Ig kappa-b4 chain C region [Takifugu flavidus]|uniref:Ig kappa-b4 chain C region n=1 Tax=Takifugu flavidus TaxID=433684 RepID=A0A5C6MDQ1_9TELE|nr:Ig kappa-b4 chain C region [Takifugu flavidus]